MFCLGFFFQFWVCAFQVFKSLCFCWTKLWMPNTLGWTIQIKSWDIPKFFLAFWRFVQHFSREFSMLEILLRFRYPLVKTHLWWMKCVFYHANLAITWKLLDFPRICQKSIKSQYRQKNVVSKLSKKMCCLQMTRGCSVLTTHLFFLLHWSCDAWCLDFTFVSKRFQKTWASRGLV